MNLKSVCAFILGVSATNLATILLNLYKKKMPDVPQVNSYFLFLDRLRAIVKLEGCNLYLCGL